MELKMSIDSFLEELERKAACWSVSKRSSDAPRANKNDQQRGSERPAGLLRPRDM